MTKHHTPTPATEQAAKSCTVVYQRAALDNALQAAEKAAQQLEQYLKAHCEGLPPGAYFFTEPGDFFTDWQLQVCQGTERRNLDAARLLAHIEQHGQVTAAELQSFEV